LLYKTFITHIGAVKMAKKEVTNATEESVAPEVAPEASGEVESISLADLSQLAQIIDLAASRGAFRGQELEPVGALFNKLSAFLGSVKEAQDAAAKEADGTDAEASVETPAGE
jgi:hypothetical protein